MTDASVPLGERLGRYRVISLLGAGGMGVVYLAEDPGLARKVALKVVSESSQTAESRMRFMREARTAAQIEHANVCTIYEVGEDQGRLFIAMQYVEGETLAQRIERDRKLPMSDILSATRGAVEGLLQAHRLGIVHRDIKPQNLIISAAGVKIVDFGLAFSISSAAEARITRTGLVSGTTPYMSPEQLRGETLTPASDVFSLGIVLYQLLSGVRPFDRSAVVDTVMAILSAEPAPLPWRGNRVSELEVLARKMLAKEPERRPDLQSVRREIERVSQLSEPEADVPTVRFGATPEAPTVAPSRSSKTASAVSPEARSAYMRGRHLLEKRELVAARESLEAFEKAIDLEPEFAAAFAGLADAYLFLGFLQLMSPAATMPRARAAALHAREIDPGLAAATATLAYIAMLYDHDAAAAETLFLEALATDPRLAIAHHWYGLFLLYTERYAPALRSLRTAHEIDPLSPILATVIALANLYSGEIDEAFRTFQEVALLAPRFAPVHFYWGLALERVGRFDEAIAALEESGRLTGEVFEQVAALAHAYAVSGQTARAISILEELRQLRSRRYIAPHFEAVIQMGLGDHRSAMAHLEAAAADRNVRLIDIHLDHRFLPLHSEPRFREIVRQVGFARTWR